MFEDAFGAQEFRRGLNLYLKKHEFDVSETSDLIAAFENATGRDLKSLISGWTDQAGYPVITVKQDGSKLILTQNRFTHKDKQTHKRLTGFVLLHFTNYFKLNYFFNN